MAWPTRRCTRTIAPVFWAVLILAGGCEKNEGPHSLEPGAENPGLPDSIASLRQIPDIQAAFFGLYEDTIADGWTDTEIDRLVTLFLTHASVSDVVLDRQGFALTYSDGRRGGILLSPDDTPVTSRDEPSGVEMPTPQPSGAAVLVSPYASRRQSQVTTFLETATPLFESAEYEGMDLLLDDACTLDAMSNLSGYGLIHVMTHSWAWPTWTDIETVYAMTGDTVVDSTPVADTTLTSGEGPIPVFVAEEKRNVNFVPVSWFATANDFSDDGSTFVFLHFPYALNEAGWAPLAEEPGVAAVVGPTWRLPMSILTSWATYFYEGMLTESPTVTTPLLASWFETTQPVYVDGATLARLAYTGDGALVLNQDVRLLSVTSRVRSGDAMTLTGWRFGPWEFGRVWFGDAPDALVEGEVLSWSEDAIVVIWPVGSGTRVSVEASGHPSNSLTFDEAAFRIDGFTPSSGRAGYTVEVNGVGFGATGSDSSVYVQGHPAHVYTWSENQIRFRVPEEARTGPITVHAGVVETSSAGDFLVFGPRLFNVTPSITTPGGTVSLIGDGFGSESDGYVTLAGETLSDISTWEDTEITLQLPETAVSGSLAVHRSGFVTTPHPLGVFPLILRRLEPAAAPNGATVAAVGEGFGTAGDVLIGDVPATISSWTTDRIEFVVPEQVVSDSVRIRTTVGESNPMWMTIAEDHLLSQMLTATRVVLRFDGRHMYLRGPSESIPVEHFRTYIQIDTDGAAPGWPLSWSDSTFSKHVDADYEVINVDGDVSSDGLNIRNVVAKFDTYWFQTGLTTESTTTLTGIDVAYRPELSTEGVFVFVAEGPSLWDHVSDVRDDWRWSDESGSPSWSTDSYLRTLTGEAPPARLVLSFYVAD